MYCSSVVIVFNGKRLAEYKALEGLYLILLNVAKLRRVFLFSMDLMRYHETVKVDPESVIIYPWLPKSSYIRST
jgi:hypothetical protein